MIFSDSNAQFDIVFLSSGDKSRLKSPTDLHLQESAIVIVLQKNEEARIPYFEYVINAADKQTPNEAELPRPAPTLSSDVILMLNPVLKWFKNL